MGSTRRVAGMAVLLVLLLPLVRTVGAAPPDQPEVGTRVRITADPWTRDLSADRPEPQPGGEFVGTVLEIDSDTIAIESQSSEAPVLIPRSAITRLEISQGSRRLKNALIGAGIGALASVGVAAAASSDCEGDLCGLEYAVFPVFGIPIGAVVGLLTGGERWEDASETKVALSLTPCRGGLQFGVSLAF